MRALEILDSLKDEYPNAAPLLHYRNPFELLVSVILSAQTTDAQVNRITPELFRRYPGPEELAAAVPEDVEQLVHSVGFFRTKARNIRAAAHVVAHEYGGVLPDTIEKLVRIPGVGRKSANVLLSHVFEKPGIIVDTHFSRVTRRLGLTGQTDPERIERDVAAFLPPDSRTSFSMTVNYHGRYCCKARRPECFRCVVRRLCDYPQKTEAPEPGDAE